MPYGSVLIIEDDYGRMQLCQEAFKGVSPETEIMGVDNLSDALKSIKIKRYDLYFCDCDFPEFSKNEDPKQEIKRGAFFDFYDELIKIHPDANILVCSCLEENVTRAKSLGLSAHLKGRISLWDIAEGNF